HSIAMRSALPSSRWRSMKYDAALNAEGTVISPIRRRAANYASAATNRRLVGRRGGGGPFPRRLALRVAKERRRMTLWRAGFDRRRRRLGFLRSCRSGREERGAERDDACESDEPLLHVRDPPRCIFSQRKIVGENRGVRHRRDRL